MQRKKWLKPHIQAITASVDCFHSFSRFTMLRRLAPLAPLFLLTACGSSASVTLDSHLQNPLYAEQYYDAQVENMVNMIIASGSMLQDPAVKDAVNDTRLEGLRLAKEATAKQAQGAMGGIMSDTQSALGEVLLLDGTVYLGPDFRVVPGINVHAYVSTVVDPREGEFPDETAQDLGPVRNTFGNAVYPGADLENAYTFVLYDKGTKQVVGFAQLTTR